MIIQVAALLSSPKGPEEGGKDSLIHMLVRSFTGLYPADPRVVQGHDTPQAMILLQSLRLLTGGKKKQYDNG